MTGALWPGLARHGQAGRGRNEVGAIIPLGGHVRNSGQATSCFCFYNLDLPPVPLQPIPIRSEGDTGDQE